MRVAFLLSILGVSLLAIAGVTGLRGGQARAQTTTAIEVGNYYFCDQSFGGGVCEKAVIAGDTVKWEFMAGPHTVTQCNETFATCPPAGGFDSGFLNTGQVFSHTFNTPGAFAYRCNVHPSQMRGRITVAPAPATPSATPAASPTATALPTPPLTPPASPAAAPKAGGPPEAGGSLPWSGLLALAGGLLALGAGGLIPVLLRRR